MKIEDLVGKRVRLHLIGGRFVEGVCGGCTVGIRGNTFTTFPSLDKRGLYYVDATRRVDVWVESSKTWLPVGFDKP